MPAYYNTGVLCCHGKAGVHDSLFINRKLQSKLWLTSTLQVLLKFILKLTDLALKAFAYYHAVDLTSACRVCMYALASLRVDSVVWWLRVYVTGLILHRACWIFSEYLVLQVLLMGLLSSRHSRNPTNAQNLHLLSQQEMTSKWCQAVGIRRK